jgi:1-acyl-sn-glycerol-3-phosphate acyltransferase
MFRLFVKWCVKIFTLILFRVETHGQENIEKGKPYIMCANHTSNWDPVVLYTATNREMYMMSKEELFVNKFVYWFAGKMNVFPVRRGKQDIESIKKSLKVLKDNKILAIFPEGTRNGMKKNGKIQNGPSYLAARSGVEVIPVRIEGNFKPFRKVKIHYGKPLNFSKYQSKKPEKQTLDLISGEITKAIFGDAFEK